MYETAGGRRPVRVFLDGLSDHDAASVVAAMADVRDLGLEEARHLRGDIYEVRAEGERAAYASSLLPRAGAGRCSWHWRPSRRRHSGRLPT
jgi:hypothetical protein